MMGEFLLVAPLFNMESERKVILPKGNWYDFYTGEYVGNGEIITVSPGLDKIPVFAKDGAIIPMIQKIRQTSEWVKNTPLEIRVYGTAAEEFVLYDDDGKSFNFEKGEFTTKLLKVENGKGIVEDIHQSENWSFGEVSWNIMTKN
jgi:alpha-D-xyloside xylohydrolase